MGNVLYIYIIGVALWLIYFYFSRVKILGNGCVC